jgi:LuxR family transcriptional regulator, maltose regulon positive regulatory protein
VVRLTERTEGWVAGLQLAGVSLQGRENPGAFVQTLSGSHRFILDYLTEEALKTQPPDVQDFLLETSILPRLSGDLCDAVTGRRTAPACWNGCWLPTCSSSRSMTRGAGIAIITCLPNCSSTNYAANALICLSELHQRASLWHESQGDPGLAIEHGLQAADLSV